MYRPSKYDKHNETLEYFANLFNTETSVTDIIMSPNKEETFDNDGYFIDLNTGEKIGFDWEYRDRYFKNGNFCFDSLGQYERKLRKASIRISLQCDSTQTAVLVAWHEDFLLEDKVRLSLATDYNQKQNGDVRYTKEFKIYRYGEIKEFKQMLKRAFITKTENCSVF